MYGTNNPVQHPSHEADSCTAVPELQRLQYFFGQMLSVADFRSEQQYFLEKLKLHNRCFHGYGTVCGLRVEPAPFEKPCETENDRKRHHLHALLVEVEEKLAAAEKAGDAATEAALKIEIEEIRQRLECLPKECPPPPVRPKVIVECGVAVDCQGNEIIVRRPQTLDLWALLSADDKKAFEHDARTVYLSVCFCERPVSPVRLVNTDTCDPSSDCLYGRMQDSFRFSVSLKAPEHDHRCETCCTDCGQACLLLARIDCVRAEGGVEPWQIHNHVRRLLAKYETTRIVGVNWTHGATYSVEEADQLLGGSYAPGDHQGLVIQFSQPVRIDSLMRGVVDLWVIEGGEGRRAGLYNLAKILTPHEPDSRGFTRRIHVRYRGDETLENGDRVLITIRCAFIVDECCRGVDGVNVGGFVPHLPGQEFEKFRKELPHRGCAQPPGHYGPWTTGVGVPGTTFESWFFIHREHEPERPPQPRWSQDEES
jgi:hypothetical protein